MARKGNFKVLENYRYFLPSFGNIVVLTLMLLLGAILGNAATLLMMKFGGNEFAQGYGTLISYVLMFIPPFIYAGTMSRLSAWQEHATSLDSSHFKPVSGLCCALAASAGVLALSFCSDALNSLMPPMPEFLEEMLKSLTQGNFLINLLCVSIAAPFCEEWLCRGMVLRGLLGHNVKPVPAILFSAFFFALIHANPWQAIPAFLFGCLFGWIYYKTGSLKLTMLMHCVNNTFALVIGHMDRFKDVDNWMDVLEPRQYAIIFAACALAVILTILTFKKIPQEDIRGNLDRS